MSPDQTDRKTVRMIHGLARSGGTIISRCIAALPDVVLYSEIHADGPIQIGRPSGQIAHSGSILWQTETWYPAIHRHLGDIDTLDNRLRNDADVLKRVIEASYAENRLPVIRDWSFGDFIGWPVEAEPGNRLSVHEALAADHDISALVILRHPLACFMSYLQSNPANMAYLSLPGIEKFMAGYRRFLEATANKPRLRYEDFLADPNTAIRKAAEALQLTFIEGFADNWSDRARITGDATASRSQAIGMTRQIEIPASIVDFASRQRDVQAILASLDYPPVLDSFRVV